MIQIAQEEPEWLKPLAQWRQGDYSLDLKQIIWGAELSDGELLGEAADVIGIVVITQTCDIVNWGDDKQYVTVAALADVPAEKLPHLIAGRVPSWAVLETPHAPAVGVDLNQLMTIHKSVLASLTRLSGFSSDVTRARFSDTLARKHGRFAFPDNFCRHVLEPLKTRIRSGHEKDSDQGKALRSIDAVRAVASPSWEAEEIKVGFRFILADESKRLVDRSRVSCLLGDYMSKIKWPRGMEPEEPPFQLQTLDEMTARELLDSQEVDFNFISWAGKAAV